MNRMPGSKTQPRLTGVLSVGRKNAWTSELSTWVRAAACDGPEIRETLLLADDDL